LAWIAFLSYNDPDTGLQKELEVPATLTVCPKCKGEGVSDPAAFDGGFTQSEFFECFEEPEDRMDYFNGVYQVTCTDCDGENVVPCIDERVFLQQDPNGKCLDPRGSILLSLWEKHIHYTTTYERV